MVCGAHFLWRGLSPAAAEKGYTADNLQYAGKYEGVIYK